MWKLWRGRPNGERVRDLPPGRALMPFLVRTRSEAANYFAQDIQVDALLDYAEDFAKRTGTQVGLFALVIRALAQCLHEFPKLNRYVSGRRIYQRSHVAITFSGRASRAEGSAIYLRKRVFPAGEALEDLARSMSLEVLRGRSGARSAGERLMERVVRLPWPCVAALLRVVHLLDDLNLLPARMIQEDPMYASAFVAHLGSVGVREAYHSLYEHGDTPLVVVIGEVRAESERTTQDGGARRVVTLSYTYDGRVEDGWHCARFVRRVKELLEDPRLLCGAQAPSARNYASAVGPDRVAPASGSGRLNRA